MRAAVLDPFGVNHFGLADCPVDPGAIEAYVERVRREAASIGFMERNDGAAPSAYPHVHSLTTPMRAAARARGEPDLINLWAGQGHALMPHSVSAEEVIARMADEIRAALDGVRARL